MRAVFNEIVLEMSSSIRIKEDYFSIDSHSDGQCYRRHRFIKSVVLKLSNIFVGLKILRNRYICSPITVTFIMLRRLAYTCRWQELEQQFSMHHSELREVFYLSVYSLFSKYGNLLTKCRTNQIRQPANMYEGVVRGSGAMLNNCVGFI